MGIYLSARDGMPAHQYLAANYDPLPELPTWPGQEADWYPVATILALDYRPVIVCWFKREMERTYRSYQRKQILWYQIRKTDLEEWLGPGIWKAMQSDLRDNSLMLAD